MLTIKPFLNKSYKKVVFSEEKRQESMKEYENMKNRIYKDTIKYGAIITSYSFLSHGPVNGLSSMVGVGASTLYVSMLYKYVDNLENNNYIFKNQFVIPLSISVFESVWNYENMPFDFNYMTTMFSFFVYKIAILSVSYDMVKHALENEDVILKKTLEIEDDDEMI